MDHRGSDRLEDVIGWLYVALLVVGAAYVASQLAF